MLFDICFFILFPLLVVLSVVLVGLVAVVVLVVVPLLLGLGQAIDLKKKQKKSFFFV